MTTLGTIPRTADIATTNDALPVGVLMPCARNAIPTGWLACDGSLQSTTTFASLFAVIGHKYNGGVDPGGGQFRLPNLRRAFPAGVGASGGLSGTSRAASGGGPKLGTWNHSHTVGSYAAASHQHGAGNVTAPDHAHGHNLAMGDHNHSLSYNNVKIHNSANSGESMNRNNFTDGANTLALNGGLTGSGAKALGGASDFATVGMTGATGTENPGHQFMLDWVIKT